MSEPVENPYRLYWRNGETEVIYGTSILQAVTKKYGQGEIINQIAWYGTTAAQLQDWDPVECKWVPRELF